MARQTVELKLQLKPPSSVGGVSTVYFQAQTDLTDEFKRNLNQPLNQDVASLAFLCGGADSRRKRCLFYFSSNSKSDMSMN
jgi:hypothetical protein